MAQKMTFNYFYGNEADQFSFYRIPKLLFTNDYFRDLSSDAKILYGLMLDRMSLSVKNHWFDDKNRAYIYFSIEDIMELLNCGKNKAVKSLRELDDETGIGLIEKRRQGFGKANIIYVKSFVIDDETGAKQPDTECSKGIRTKTAGSERVSGGDFQSDDARQMEATETEYCPAAKGQRFTYQTCDEGRGDQEVSDINFKRFTKQTSRIPQNKLQEVYKVNPNNTYYSDTDINYKSSYPILSMDQGYVPGSDEEDRYDNEASNINPVHRSVNASNGSCDLLKEYQDLVRRNIEYDTLLEARPEDRELIQQICDMIVEVVLSRNKEILVASCRYPVELVRSRFLKLNYDHILYVLDCLERTTTKVKNIRKYMMAALFNAPVTIDGYYRAEVKHDVYRDNDYV